MDSDNPFGADNQQGSRRHPLEDGELTPQRLHAELLAFGATGLEAYLQGALKDGTFSARHRTHRIGQADEGWVEMISFVLTSLGYRSWIYREGRERRFWVVETTAPFLSLDFDARPLVGRREGLAYARGYFDAEGGIPRQASARMYVALSQKSYDDLNVLRQILESWAISCGKIHNPSVRVDPHYWRFYVRARSHERFIRLVGTSHPGKLQRLINRMKI
jgi:hypothetical protein